MAEAQRTRLELAGSGWWDEKSGLYLGFYTRVGVI